MGHLSDVGCRKGVLSNLESGVWDLDSGIWILDSEIWNLESEIWNLESEIWNLKSGIWNLESGIWNHGASNLRSSSICMTKGHRVCVALPGRIF